MTFAGEVVPERFFCCCCCLSASSTTERMDKEGEMEEGEDLDDVDFGDQDGA